MGKIKDILNNSSGAISIFTVLILLFLLPFAIWVGVELPKMHEANQRVKDAVDSAAASSVTLIDKSKFEEGQVLLDKGSVKVVALQIVAEKLGVDTKTGELLPKEGSAIKADGIDIKVRVIDDSDMPGGAPVIAVPEVPGETWNKKITNPTVIVEAKITYKKIGWWGNDLTVYQTGMSQVVNKLK